MDPNVWGKHMWSSIHFIALGYPNTPSETDKKNYKQFFDNLYSVLPCHTCSEHLKQTLLSALPLHANHLVNTNTLFKWTVDLHNIVNKRLKKPTMGLHDATQLYFKRDLFQNMICPENNEVNVGIMIFAFLIIFLIIFVSFNVYHFFFGKHRRFT